MPVPVGQVPAVGPCGRSLRCQVLAGQVSAVGPRGRAARCLAGQVSAGRSSREIFAVHVLASGAGLRGRCSWEIFTVQVLAGQVSALQSSLVQKKKVMKQAKYTANQNHGVSKVMSLLIWPLLKPMNRENRRHNSMISISTPFRLDLLRAGTSREGWAQGCGLVGMGEGHRLGFGSGVGMLGGAEGARFKGPVARAKGSNGSRNGG